MATPCWKNLPNVGDHHWLTCTTIVLVLAVAIPTPEAQEVAHSLDQLRQLVGVGDKVIITDLQGRETQGSVAELSSSSLRLLVGGVPTDFAEEALHTVSRRDSRWNGTLWGLGIGGVLGAGLNQGLVKEYGREDIGVGESVAFIVEAAGVGAGVGFAVDALIKGRRLIYSRSQASMRRDLTVLPMWVSRRKGVSVSLRF
jgi:hypothetical protein